jgi:hypothetical protein
VSQAWSKTRIRAVVASKCRNVCTGEAQAKLTTIAQAIGRTLLFLFVWVGLIPRTEHDLTLHHNHHDHPQSGWHLYASYLESGVWCSYFSLQCKFATPSCRGNLSSHIPSTLTVKQYLISGHEPQMGLDTKTDWPTDRRSQRDSLTLQELVTS